MPFKRLHSNGFEVVVYLQPAQHEWCLVQVKSGLNRHSAILGLKTSLDMAQALGDSVARVDHLCNDQCGDWKATLSP